MRAYVCAYAVEREREKERKETKYRIQASYQFPCNP